MDSSPRHVDINPKRSTSDEFFSPKTSPSLEQAALPTTPSSSLQKSPSSAKRLKNFFQDLQRESRHALTNKKAKIVQLWEGRRWRRMSVEEVEPFAEMEEKELSNYGATELVEYNSNREDSSVDRQDRIGGGQTEVCVVEHRC